MDVKDSRLLALTDYEKRVIKSFPGLSAATIETVNNLFQHYLFVNDVNDGWEVACTHCHKQWKIDMLRQVETPEEYEIINSRHGQHGVCPHCGAEIIYKRVNKYRNLNSLDKMKCVAVWNYRAGRVMVQCYWVAKSYSKGNFGGKLYWNFDTAYSFEQGRAYQFDMNYGVYNVRLFMDGSRKLLCEPFWKSYYTLAGRIRDYIDIGRYEAIERSFLRYSGLRQFESRWEYFGEHTTPMKFCALASNYPHAVEMLLKAGLISLIEDYCDRGKKNKAVLDWSADSLTDAFELSKQEFKAFMDLPMTYTDVIAIYKYARKQGWQINMQWCYELYIELDSETNVFLKACKRWKITPVKLQNYLMKFTGPRCHGAGCFSLRNALQMWTDYLDAAKEIGYDLKNETVVFPKRLELRHDEATGEHRRRLSEATLAEALEARRKAEQEDAELRFGWQIAEGKRRMAQKQELETRRSRYNYTDGEYFIRIAETSKEIIAEGVTLGHCVGGYAQRHMEGKTTICFMRKCAEPDKPWITIEMMAGNLRQVHGYKNERQGKDPDPRKEYAKFLDPWLLWVADGSKRDKDGKPVIKKAKRKAASKAA